jgi:hypothetical protein
VVVEVVDCNPVVVKVDEVVVVVVEVLSETCSYGRQLEKDNYPGTLS